MSATLDGIDLKVSVREVGDTEWKRMVCELDSSEELTNDVNEVESKCGIHVSIKPVKANVSGNAVCNGDPDSDEVSYDDVRNWQMNRTALEMRIENETFTAENGVSYTEGQVYHHFYTGKFVQSNITEGVGDPAKFAWTFKPTSTPVDTGASTG